MNNGDNVKLLDLLIKTVQNDFSTKTGTTLDSESCHELLIDILNVGESYMRRLDIYDFIVFDDVQLFSSLVDFDKKYISTLESDCEMTILKSFTDPLLMEYRKDYWFIVYNHDIKTCKVYSYSLAHEF